MIESARREKARLFASAVDRASTACFTVGVATPLAGFVYNIAGIGTLAWWRLAPGVGGRFWAPQYYIGSLAGSLETLPMNAIDQSWLLAFVVTPAFVVLVAYVGTQYWRGQLRKDRRERHHPAE